MNIEKIEEVLAQSKEPKFRLPQIKKAIFQETVLFFSEISTIPKNLREVLEKTIPIFSFEEQEVLVSKNKDSAKALLKLSDGNFIETVLISPKPGDWSVCVSSQVGCAMGCRFCATGKMGFIRNLTAEEITDQVLFWKQYLKKNFKFEILNLKLNDNEIDKKNNSKSLQNSIRQPADKIENCNVVSNIVYMGMGEPFNNWENVSKSLKDLTDPKLFAFGSRSISVSTSGIAEGIIRMAKEFPQVNLAISLHFATEEKRSDFMPVNKKDNMESLKNSLQEYFQITRRKVFLEYIMLDEINDTVLDARKLSEYLKSIGNMHLLHINLIRYNATSAQLKPSSKSRTEIFKNELQKLNVSTTIRKSLGDEISGACGQLAGK